MIASGIVRITFLPHLSIRPRSPCHSNTVPACRQATGVSHWRLMRLVGRLLSNAEIAGSSHHIHDLKADRFAHIKTERQAAPPEGFAARAEAGGWSGYRPL